MGAPRSTELISTIVFHCADVPNGRDDRAEDIDRWHGERGFNRDMTLAPEYQPHLTHIGYHFVIELSGQIIAGRPLTETGAHVAGWNHDTIGVCMIGRDKFTAEQWEAARALTIALKATVPSVRRIAGHREFSPKSCPGFDVVAWVAADFTPAADNLLTLEAN